MPNVPVWPYDSAGYVLQQAIIKSGDTNGPQGIAGNLLNANQPGVIPLLNVTYRELQDRLISRSVETFNEYWEIIGVPPADTSNPSDLVWFDYQSYFDGNQNQGKWHLPPNMLKPLEMWQRQTGNNRWILMKMVPDAIETSVIKPYPDLWDYQSDKIYMRPFSQTNDFKIKGLCYAPDLTDVTSPVLVPRCQSALAYLMMVEVAKMRGGLEMAAVWKQDAQAYEDAIVNRTARKDSYAAFFRQPFRSRGRGRSSGR